ncbi:YrhA family protein [Citrobacter werkmanii]|uniref:YrhA family protein n=1 Tax=Citrobacter werkmanii TaxID=67827 RepID=UPI003463AB43
MKRAELDVVVLGEDLPNEGLVKGTVGTIVMVFDTPTLGYLVEFCDEEGRTIAMPALLPAQLKSYFTPGILKTLLVDNNYPVANPVDPDVMADLMRKAAPAEWDAQKRKVFEDIQRLMIHRLDYSDMFEIMDGLEYNGLTLYSLVQADNDEPVWSNIYIRNFETRDNDIYVDPNLSDKVLIGEDGMSVFAYSFKDDCFEIRDKASTGYVIESHINFSTLLSALIDTVKF